MIDTGELGNMHDVIEVTAGEIRMKYRPENLLVVSEQKATIDSSSPSDRSRCQRRAEARCDWMAPQWGARVGGRHELVAPPGFLGKVDATALLLAFHGDRKSVV